MSKTTSDWNYSVGHYPPAYGYMPEDQDNSFAGMIINGVLKFFELLFDCTIGFVIDKISNIGASTASSTANPPPSLQGRVGKRDTSSDSRSVSASTSDEEELENSPRIKDKLAHGITYLKDTLADEYNLTAAIATNQKEIGEIVQFLKDNPKGMQMPEMSAKMKVLPTRINNLFWEFCKKVTTGSRTARPINNNEAIAFFETLHGSVASLLVK